MSEPSAGLITLGARVGNYVVVRRISRGGMAMIYEALHTQLGGRAAIKILAPQHAADAELSARFLNEGRVVNLIPHPGVVKIFEYGHLDDGSPYIVMEYLDGELLSARLLRLAGQMAVPEALRLSRQIASALAAAHDRGVVHRDLKPDNVIIVPDPEAAAGERARLIDFGIAKRLVHGDDDGPAYRTQTGALLGTPTYMAPEQFKGARGVDDRADVYSLGVMLYEMLAGRTPFQAATPVEMMDQHLLAEVPPLSELAWDVPEGVAELVHGMLRKDRDLRPSMWEVIAQMEAAGAPVGRHSVMKRAPLLLQAQPDAVAVTVSQPQGAWAETGTPVGAVADAAPGWSDVMLDVGREAVDKVKGWMRVWRGKKS